MSNPKTRETESQMAKELPALRKRLEALRLLMEIKRKRLEALLLLMEIKHAEYGRSEVASDEETP